MLDRPRRASARTTVVPGADRAPRVVARPQAPHTADASAAAVGMPAVGPAPSTVARAARHPGLAAVVPEPVSTPTVSAGPPGLLAASKQADETKAEAAERIYLAHLNAGEPLERASLAEQAGYLNAGSGRTQFIALEAKYGRIVAGLPGGEPPARDEEPAVA
ncbi:MAG: hypothetical protein HOV66_28305 [Streptomycetaceae bacterium]|nr:hypothetical protein [Streptomycetaceae bacterium]